MSAGIARVKFFSSAEKPSFSMLFEFVYNLKEEVRSAEAWFSGNAYFVKNLLKKVTEKYLYF